MNSLQQAIIVCPTLNPGDDFCYWISAVLSQGVSSENVLIVDSASSDQTKVLASKAGFKLEKIARKEFNHGGTRQRAVNSADSYEYLVFLTQDAMLSDSDSLRNIIRYFDYQEVAAVCGRQLPRKAAKAIGAHARIYNYGAQSFIRSMSDAKIHGLKTAFISNSFAAYRISALKEVGGFPDNVIFGEDMYVAAKLLLAGYKVAYAADACVYHSHDYSFRQEFRRYFDMGVFHSREFWIRQEFGGAEGEGVKFVSSEFKYLFKHAFWRIPEGLLRTLFRYVGFRLGLMENGLPIWLKKWLAMNKGYFKKTLVDDL